MNQDMIPLNRVPEGRVARVIDLFTTGNMRRRLQDIGLIEGKGARANGSSRWRATRMSEKARFLTS